MEQQYQEYIGTDLHAAFFSLCAIHSNGERLQEQRWSTTDRLVAVPVEIEPRFATADRLVAEDNDFPEEFDAVLI